MKNILLSLFLFISFYSYSQQQLVLQKTISLGQAVAASLDNHSNLYIALANGNILKFTKEGEQAAVYSPQSTTLFKSIEAWPSMQIAAFDAGNQTFYFLDRFLIEKSKVAVPQNKIGFAEVANISNDNKIWVIDATDFQLKKWDQQNEQILLQIPLNISFASSNNTSVLSVKEYQNKLYILSENQGVAVFDNLGNFEKTLQVGKTHSIDFNKTNLFYLTPQTCNILNLQTQELSRIPLPEDKDYKIIAVRGKNVWLINDTSADLYLLLN